MTEPVTIVSTETPNRSPGPRRRWFRFLSCGLLLGLLLATAWWVSSVERSFSKGKLLLRQLREVEAEKELEKYLLLHARNPQAILLWAEAVLMGDSRSPVDAAKLALSRLADIPDKSPLSGEARMREGRLALLILNQPDRAESLLSHSAALDPDLADTHYLLWKLLDLTERFHDSGPHFWKLYELTPDASKPERLREWYISQFSPISANAELDRRMGFLRPDQAADNQTTLIRLKEFMWQEPQSPMVCAALASWLIDANERDDALLQLTRNGLSSEAFQNPHYVAAMVKVLIELGRLDEAKASFVRWPQPLEGFLYWQTAGRFFEVVDRNDKAAVEAYDKALSVWPGPADWSIMHRKAQCLNRLGNREAAETVRVEAKRIELLMETEVHRTLRLAVLDLRNPNSLRQMVEFYQAIHCTREAKCWQNAFDRLPQNSATLY